MSTESSLAAGSVAWPVAVASLALIALALGLAGWLRLGITRDVAGAAVRAALQLVGVGLVFALIFRADAAIAWAWAWVGVMVVVATVVVIRRARVPVPRLGMVAAASVLGSAGVSIVVVFGFGVVTYDPVSLVVVAGITIGNAVPSAVLGVNRSIEAGRERVGEIDALLALGMDRRQVMRFLSPREARTALIPQVERTRVVGLIALPGAMTGLLLAGVDPLEAVAVQLLVMYLVLGTAALCVVATVSTVVAATVTEDLHVADWVRAG